MRVSRLTRTTALPRPSWLDVFHAISELTRSHGLPIPIEILHVGSGVVRVRLESNADALRWMRCVDPRAKALRLPGPRGRLFATCTWMGWTLTITGASQQPTSYDDETGSARRGVDGARRDGAGCGAGGSLDNKATGRRQEQS